MHWENKRQEPDLHEHFWSRYSVPCEIGTPTSTVNSGECYSWWNGKWSTGRIIVNAPFNSEKLAFGYTSANTVNEDIEVVI